MYHYTQNDRRTELYYILINFGNFCSGIAEQKCFLDKAVSAIIENSLITESLGLPYRNVLGIIFSNFVGHFLRGGYGRGGIPHPCDRPGVCRSSVGVGAYCLRMLGQPNQKEQKPPFLCLVSGMRKLALSRPPRAVQRETWISFFMGCVSVGFLTMSVLSGPFL